MGDAGVPCGAMLDTGEVLADPHLRARDMIVDVDYPTRGTYQTVGCPVKLSDSPAEVTRPPLLGEHTAEVLSALCGVSADEVQRLRAGHGVDVGAAVARVIPGCVFHWWAWGATTSAAASITPHRDQVGAQGVGPRRHVLRHRRHIAARSAAAEEFLGQALDPRRKDVVLATEERGDLCERTAQRITARIVVSGVEASLRRLNTDWIDLLSAAPARAVSRRVSVSTVP